MKLRRRNSPRVIDRRGAPSGRGFGLPGLGGGGGGGLGPSIPIGKGGGIGLIVVLLVLAVCVGPQVLGGDGGPFSGLNPAGTGSAPLDPATDPDAKLFQLVNDVVSDVEETWAGIFEGSDPAFEPAFVNVFSERTSSGCGAASSATGPFYCPADQQIYLDLSFFRELRDRFGAPGDFAQAYVIAHEYGHHIQNLLGINADVQQRSQEDPGQANDLSIRLELQADCLAGVWGHSAYAQDEVTTEDLNEALTAAEAIGDDRIQESTTGRIDPETWTHGSAEQRSRWLGIGFESGDPNDCDTFDGDI